MDIIIDSGASEHVVTGEEYLFDVKQMPKITVEPPNGKSVVLSFERIVKVDVGKEHPIFYKVYFIFCNKLSLISCSRMDEHGITSIFAQEMCTLWDRGEKDKLIEKS